MANIGYIRTSTDHQNLARQEQLMIDNEIDEVFADKMSGKNTDRPQFKAMMSYIRKGDTLYVDSLDRLGRNYDELKTTVEQLKNKNVNLHIEDAPFLNFNTGNETLDKAMFDMFLSLLAYIAQNEREKMLERQRQGIAKAKERGAYKGRPVKYSEDAKGSDKLVYDTIVAKLENGVPISIIAKDVGITRPTIYKIKNQIKGA